jgi:hypothetical protein
MISNEEYGLAGLKITVGAFLGSVLWAGGEETADYEYDYDYEHDEESITSTITSTSTIKRFCDECC